MKDFKIIPVDERDMNEYSCIDTGECKLFFKLGSVQYCDACGIAELIAEGVFFIGTEEECVIVKDEAFPFY